MQTGGKAQQFYLSTLARDCGAGLDSACLVGTGVSGYPLGLFKRTDTATVTFGGAATLTKLVGTSGSFESQLLTSNLASENLSWVVHPAIRGKWRTIQKFSSDAGSGTLFDTDRDYICGHQARTTSAVSSTLGVALGDFSKMVIALFGLGEGGLRIVVDPYSKSMSDRINLIVELNADINILRPEAFCIAADSAVQ